MSVEGAKRLGVKLRMEIEVEDLNSVLKSLRTLDLRSQQSVDSTTPNNFNIPELDALLSCEISPILELVSPPPAHHPTGSGKTSLLYLIIAKAILPTIIASTSSVIGLEAAVILFDPANHFSILRLVSVMLRLLKSELSAASVNIDESVQAELKSIVKRSLIHLHIFRPQSWTSLLSTLRSLPDYLFERTRHMSIHRHIHSLIIEDVDFFLWSVRSSALAMPNTSDTLTSASTKLVAQIQKLSTLFSCAAILTSYSSSPTTFRPGLPLSWLQGNSITRLSFRRVEVIKFAPTISVDEAEAERQQRWEVVGRRRFECSNISVGVRDSGCFVFRIGDGVEIERA